MVKNYSDDKMLIAHRAADSTIPENTLESMKTMEVKGAKAFEIDCYMMADGNIAVIHDKNIKRTTTGRGWITRKTADDLGDVFVIGGDGGQRIPYLEDMMDYAYKNHLFLIIEVKMFSKNLIAAIDQMITKYSCDLFTIYSFNKKVVKAFRRLQTPCPIFWNIARLTERKLSLAKEIGIGLNLDRRYVTKNDIERIIAIGQSVHIYTVNDMEEAKKLFEDGVSAIVTDKLISENEYE